MVDYNGKTYSIKRSDGLGNQICNRLFAMEYYSRDIVPDNYVHHRLNKVAHLSRHVEWKSYFDYIYKTFTGLKNDDIASETKNVEYIHKIVGGTNKPGKDQPEITLFAREFFEDYQIHFRQYNSQYMTYRDNSTFNVVMHIRRGDEWENAIKSSRQGRIKDFDYYEDICKTVFNICNSKKIKVQFYIETDSPSVVEPFADRISAKMNVVSEHATKLASEPVIDVPSEIELQYWNKLVYTIQGVYNLTTADMFIACPSAFSNLAFMLSDIPTITPVGRFNRFVLSDFPLGSKILKYIRSGPEGWNILPNDKQNRERIGLNHIVYNYSVNAARDILGAVELPGSINRVTELAIEKKFNKLN